MKLSKKLEELIPTLPGWCSVEKATAMAELVLEHKPQVTVEIGVFGGRSLAALALAHAQLRKGHVYGIDPWAKDAALESVQEKENLDWWAAQNYDAIYHNCLISMIECAPTDRWTIFRTKSERACFLFDRVDCLHIDGNHSEEKSTMDAFMWLPKVTPGGHIWFDDVDWITTANAIRIISERCERIKDVGTCALFRKL